MFDTFNFNDGIHLQLQELLGASQPRFQALKGKRKQPAMTQLRGQTRSRFRGQGMEFEEVRGYLPGDDIRNIDWRVTAKTGKTHTKVFTEDREQLVFGVLNQHKRLFFGSNAALKSVIGAHYFANILNTSRDQGHRVGAFIFDGKGHQEFKPSNRRKHLMQILSTVEKKHNLQVKDIETSGFEQPDSLGKNLIQTLDRLHKVARPGSQIHIISDLLPNLDSIWEKVALIARHNQLHIWSIVDQLDWVIPSHSLLNINNGQSKSSMWFSKQNSINYTNNFIETALEIQTKAWNSGSQIHFLGPIPNQLKQEIYNS